MKIMIPLGAHCNITTLNQYLQIKKETGVFEWHESRKLDYITNLIETLCKEPNKNVIFGSDKYLYLLHPRFFTCHYNLSEYKEIFARRYSRFIDNIKNLKEILFVRINPNNMKTTSKEIQNFVNIITKINSSLKINFLLIDTIEQVENFIPIEINDINFNHRYFFQKDCDEDCYLRENKKVANIYLNYLIEIGYEVEKNDEEFTDRSLI